MYSTDALLLPWQVTGYLKLLKLGKWERESRPVFRSATRCSRRLPCFHSLTHGRLQKQLCDSATINLIQHHHFKRHQLEVYHPDAFYIQGARPIMVVLSETFYHLVWGFELVLPPSETGVRVQSVEVAPLRFGFSFSFPYLRMGIRSFGIFGQGVAGRLDCASIYIYIYRIYTHIHIHIYMYMCVCVLHLSLSMNLSVGSF